MNDKDQMVNHAEQAAMLSRSQGNDLPESLWTYEDSRAVDNRPADRATGLVSLAFISAVIRRGARFWCATAAAGLLLGFGLYLAFPPSYQAATSVLLTYGPYEDPTTAINDAAAIAESRTVAGLAVHKLGLRQSVSSFLATYMVTGVSERVLDITVSAPSSDDAVRRANAVTAAFLQFRAGQLEAEQRLVLMSLDQQISLTRRHMSVLNQQIRTLSARTASRPPGGSSLPRLRADLSQSGATLSTLEQAVNDSQASPATTLAVQGSEVLDAAAPVPHSALKRLLLYPGAGLILGLAAGLGIVVILALTSDRLRRRDDVAQALGAPVKVSVGAVRVTRWLPGRRGLMAAGSADVQRIVDHLSRAVATTNRSALAVVPVDDPQVAALSVVALAMSGAQQGKQVVLADLCSGAPAAALLGVKEPGIHTVAGQDAHMVVVVPDPDNAAPVGPRRPRGARRSRAVGRVQAEPSSFTEAVTAACASADLLLTLATLEPSLGSEHLATWTSAVVTIVTAGRSSATRVRAVGEMIRLADMHLVSAVLVGADKTDESLGLAQPQPIPATSVAWG